MVEMWKLMVGAKFGREQAGEAFTATRNSNESSDKGDALYINGVLQRNLTEEEKAALDVFMGEYKNYTFGDALYINGVLQRNLTDAEKAALNVFMGEYKNYTFQLEQYIRSPNRLKVQFPTRPPAPPFCSNVTGYYLDGCVVMGKRLFINNVYVREISEEEERRLDEFDKQYREYMNHIKQGKRLFINNVYVREISEEEERRLDEFDKQYREYMNHIEQVNRQFVNDDDSAETSTTSSSDPTMPSVALPEDPRICISL
uniref:Pepsin inhibitor-3-like repeated domain-containing protein n=1 Tax=Parascaris univalens TaxID=6257 RepID=A0A915ABE4_PARUN